MTPAPHRGSRSALQILIVEDRAMDAELVVAALKRAGFEPHWRRVETEEDYLAALDQPLDVILADFTLPKFGAARALELLKTRRLDIPFIVVSGNIGEETAVEALKSGAADYLLKDRLARLGQAVKRALEEHRLRQAKREADEAVLATEARTQFALNAAHVGTWEADLSTGVVRWSTVLEALHGLPPGGFGGTFDAFLELIDINDRDDVQASIERAARDHVDAHVVYRTEWPDGSIHWISAIGHTFYDEDDRPVRAAGVGLDVTERRTLEEQYRHAQKMEAVGQLAGGVAHDFNNILTAIDGYAALLGDALPSSSPALADVSEIRRAVESAASLTRHLLAFSRHQMLAPRVIDLRDSLSALTPMLRRLLGEEVTVLVRANGEVGRVKADPGQIEQVVLNLAVNARDAMPRGGTLILELANVHLDERFTRQYVGVKPGPYVQLSVSDTGTGMDATTQARIFEPFFTTKPQGQGTGLGLSTVFGIVAQSGGHIGVSSDVGRGTTFAVYLPRIDAPVDPLMPAPLPRSLSGSETILVVEDEAPLRTIVQRALERHGYRLLLASTPREALEHATRKGTDIALLISDVVLPEISGGRLASLVLQYQPAVQVLFMSGYANDTVAQHGVDRGTPFLQKPFTPEALTRKVREVLDARARRLLPT